MQTALYRHFAADGALLYVGVSLSAVQRLAQHRDKAAWFASISRVDIEWFPDRVSALSAETRAIQAEKPKFNVQKRQVEPPKPVVSQVAPLAVRLTNVPARPRFRMLNAADVQLFTGLGRKQITSGASGFPQPYRLGPRTLRWHSDEVWDWMERLPAA